MINKFAHSPNKNVAGQPYLEHVTNVIDGCINRLTKIFKTQNCLSKKMMSTIIMSALFHDFGKLEEENQEILSGKKYAKRLPIIHSNAGAKYLFDFKKDKFAAHLVFSHHIGLNNYFNFEEDVKKIQCNIKYSEIHNEILKKYEDKIFPELILQLTSLDIRILLSTLVDSDHSDTAKHREQDIECNKIFLNPERRLSLLKKYVEGLAEKSKNNNEKQTERNNIRKEFFKECININKNADIYVAEGSVGVGKTTSLLGSAFVLASKYDLNRIIWVQPTTNIIEQTIKVFKESIVCNNEDKNMVVFENHSKVVYQNDNNGKRLKHLVSNWDAPIVVTTSVKFFETLANNNIMVLKKMHNIPNSVIVIDESHAALPIDLWPQAWEWLNELTTKYNCKIIFGSGTLSEFWNIEDDDGKRIFEAQPKIEKLISKNLKDKMNKIERVRVKYEKCRNKFSLNEFIKFIKTVKGPTIIVVNTIQTSAFLAKQLSKEFGKSNIEYLSTALCPEDIRIKIDKIKDRLKNKEDDGWVLVATSCVDTGVDFSFRNGIREDANFISLIQLGGRVSRECEYEDSCVYGFKFDHDNKKITSNPSFGIQVKVLDKLFGYGISNSTATKALTLELKESDGVNKKYKEFKNYEKARSFESMRKKFKVINTDTISVVVNKNIIKRLKNNEKVSAHEIKNNSVQMWRNKQEVCDVEEAEGFENLYYLIGKYDEFLGYMAGVIENIYLEEEGMVI